jgi:hypothetical protein
MAIGSSVLFGEAERCKAWKRAGSFFFLELLQQELLELLGWVLLEAILCEWVKFGGGRGSARQWV